MSARETFNMDHVAVAASQTAASLGNNGKKGDILERVILVVTTAATGTASIKDGSATAIPIAPANTPIGPHVIEIGARSKVGAWQITTGAGAAVIAIGRFS